MLREVDITELWDGRFYGLEDMVKAGCHECEGCSACCHGMGSSILLDPMDVHRLGQKLSMTFPQMLSGKVLELNMVDGLLLPNLKFDEETDACPFLSGEGRCRIHDSRPGICRIFPLGRYYEGEDFHYFLQRGECSYPRRYKVKVKKWIDTPDPVGYGRYINAWHSFARKAGESMGERSEEEQHMAVLYILKFFFEKEYDAGESFFFQFDQRIQEAGDVLF